MLIETPDKEVLNKAKMAEFNRVAMTDPAKNWIEQLTELTLAYEREHYPRKRARKKNDAEAFETAIGAFAADLLLHRVNTESEGFMYRRFDRQELATSLISATNLKKLVELWCELGWVEITGHIHAPEEFGGAESDAGYFRTRRYRATASFEELAQSFQITPSAVTDNFDIDISASDLVQIRKKNKKRFKLVGRGRKAPFKVSKFQEQIATMKRLNAALAEHKFSLGETPVVRRLFNCASRDDFDFNLGGRFYCQSADNWMNKPKEERREIRIDGEPTVEIDVSASQLFILYALHGQRLDYSNDPYSVGGFPREIVKQVIVTMIGAGKSPKRWPTKFNEEYFSEHGRMPNDDYKLSAVVESVLEKHPILKNLKTNSLDWANLQFEESECFLSAMLELHETHDVPSLPVHDSLIVQHSDADVASEVLAGAYRKRFDVAPQVKVAGF